MQLSHDPLKTHASFDDPNLVSQSGLVPVMALAGRCGLADLAGEHVKIASRAGANLDRLPVQDAVAAVDALPHSDGAQLNRGDRCLDGQAVEVLEVVVGHEPGIGDLAAQVATRRHAEPGDLCAATLMAGEASGTDPQPQLSPALCMSSN